MPEPQNTGESVEYRVTKEVIVAAPRGDHAAAALVAHDLWHRAEIAYDQDIHNELARHKSRLTIEVIEGDVG